MLDPIYTKFAKWYDELYASKRQTEKEVDFLRRIFAKFGCRKILDLACGSGRHTLQLAKLGYEVTGVDLSKELLAIANEKAVREGLKVNLCRGDMRNFKLNEKFDAAVIMFSSFLYIWKVDDQINTFDSVRRVLRKGGVLIIDVAPIWKFLTQKFKHRIVKVHGRGRKKFVIVTERKINRADCLFEERVAYAAHFGNRKCLEAKYKRKMFCFTPSYFRLLCRLTNFRIIDFYGSFSFEPLSKAERLILIAQKMN